MPFTPASAAPPSILYKREIHRCCDARNCPQPDLAGLPSGPCLDANGLAKGETAIREFCFEPVAQPAVVKSVDGEQLEMPKRMQLAVVISGSMIGREKTQEQTLWCFITRSHVPFVGQSPKFPKQIRLVPSFCSERWRRERFNLNPLCFGSLSVLAPSKARSP